MMKTAAVKRRARLAAELSGEDAPLAEDTSAGRSRWPLRNARHPRLPELLREAGVAGRSQRTLSAIPVHRNGKKRWISTPRLEPAASQPRKVLSLPSFE